MYQHRFYRGFFSGGYKQEVVYKESDLFILSDRSLEQKNIQRWLQEYYSQIEEHIKNRPDFFTALSPIPEDESAPEIIKAMYRAAHLSRIGPFAAVAGAIAQFVGERIIRENKCAKLIVENGGDVYIKTDRELKIGLYVGNAFFDVLKIKIKKRYILLG